MTPHPATAPMTEPRTPTVRPEPPSALASALPSTAREVARRLLDAALPCGDGALTWLAPEAPGAAAPRALPPHLYDGSAGVALFLAAVAGTAPDPEPERLRRAALAALAPLRRRLLELADDPRRAASLRLAIGGFVGLGSFIYALTRTGRELGDPSLVADAARITVLLTAERLERDEHLDVLSGTAGSLLAILALHDALAVDPGLEGHGDRLLDLARRCGDHLLRRRVRWRGLPRAWPGADRPPLSGFAHGAAGIALALLRLDSLSGCGRYRAAAREAFEFERALFLPAAGTWLDPRRGRPLEQSAWCHGTPGVALGRLRAAALDDDPAIAEDLELALEATTRLAVKRVDHLCCGNAGQVEILLLAAAATGRGELAELAHGLARQVVARGVRLTTPGVVAAEPFEPSLLLGLAGWGWAQRQRESGGELPSPLAME